MMGAVVVGGDYQGLGIIRALGRHQIPLYLLDTGPCIGRASRFTSKFMKCPTKEKEMVRFLIALSVAEKLGGWVIYPTTEKMVRLLSINRASLKQYYSIPVPEWPITRTLYDKRQTYELAARLGIPHPKTLSPHGMDDVAEVRGLRFPVIIKPCTRGQFFEKTRRKALLCRNREELISRYGIIQAMIPNVEVIVQELVPGGPSNLYSFCSLFRDGRAMAKLVARRPRQHPMDFGRASTFVETVDLPELEEIGTRLLTSIGYRGLSEVEFMWDPRDREYKLIEVNARTWGWHTVGNRVGIDFAFLLYQDLTGEGTGVRNSPSGTGKWLRILTDTPLALKEILCGRLKAQEYIASLKGEKEYAVWSPEDPGPFFLELLLLPYLLKTRGY